MYVLQMRPYGRKSYQAMGNRRGRATEGKEQNSNTNQTKKPKAPSKRAQLGARTMTPNFSLMSTTTATAAANPNDDYSIDNNSFARDRLQPKALSGTD